MIMDETITIRSCSLHDVEALMSVGIRTFRDTFDEVNTPENMMLYLNKTFTLRKIKEEIQEQGSMFFIAEEHNECVGYARVRSSKVPDGLTGVSAMEIERLYADKKFIGKRVGYLLINTCLRYAKEHGYQVVWLGVWEHNARAIAFYQRSGFERFGQHTFMLGHDAQTDLLMKKVLS
jgi:ribosomal protein S18 acetylase RimI-like enzyme